MLIPVDFQPLPDELLAKKYAYFRRPTVMFSNLRGDIDLGVNITDKYWSSADIPMLKDIYKASLAATYTKLTFHQEAVKTIKNRLYVVLEFDAILADEEERSVTSSKPPIRRYYYMMYTVVEDRIVVFNFNAPIHEKTYWQPIAQQIMQSVRLKNLSLPKTNDKRAPANASR